MQKWIDLVPYCAEFLIWCGWYIVVQFQNSSWALFITKYSSISNGVNEDNKSYKINAFRGVSLVDNLCTYVDI